MKLDEIIEKLERVKAYSEGGLSNLAQLVIELAHHVKAQEPEQLSEEEMIASLNYLEDKHGSKE